MTDDFDDSAVFQLNAEYAVRLRTPSSPGVPPGLSLDSDGTHFGWIRERSRAEVEKFMDQGTCQEGQEGQGGQTVRLRITSLGKRWLKWDGRLKIHREWKEGKAVCWLETEEAETRTTSEAS
ncbi:MAG TPA: hypothetical protein VFQ43_00790 [Nitrososphaera sp.]|nr:hypothetical protein [Nitrososphaera sp.]